MALALTLQYQRIFSIIYPSWHPNNNKASTMSHLARIFDLYGYTKEQQLYLIKLLYLADCFEPEKLKNDLKAAGFSASAQQHALDAQKFARGEPFQDKDSASLNAELLLT